jgi:hypothetical protein
MLKQVKIIYRIYKIMSGMFPIIADVLSQIGILAQPEVCRNEVEM